MIITAKEASKILGVSKRTLYRWEIEGKLKSEREGILKVRIYNKDYIEKVRDYNLIVEKVNKLIEQFVKQVHEELKS